MYTCIHKHLLCLIEINAVFISMAEGMPQFHPYLPKKIALKIITRDFLCKINNLFYVNFFLASIILIRLYRFSSNGIANCMHIIHISHKVINGINRWMWL